MKKLLVYIILILALAATSGLANVVTFSSNNYELQGGSDFGGGKAESDNFSAFSSSGNMETKNSTSENYTCSSGLAGSILASAAPTITSIDPSSGYNISSIHINTILGTRFVPNATVKLTATGQSDIVATNVEVTNSSTEIECDLNIAGAEPGDWTVVVENSSTETASLTDGFEVMTYTFNSSIAINSPNPFDPATETTTIVYKLTEDTNVVLTIFNTTGDLLWKRNYASGTQGGKVGDNGVTWDGITDFSNTVSNGVYPFHVIDRGSGKTLARGKIAVIRQ